MSQNCAPTTTAQVITQDALFETCASWSNSYDFRAFYEWTNEQAAGARERVDKHEADCCQKTEDLQKLVAAAMQAHCASSKQACAKIEGYENLLFNVAAEMRRKDEVISNLKAILDKSGQENASGKPECENGAQAAAGAELEMRKKEWDTKEEEYRVKIRHFESSVAMYQAAVAMWTSMVKQGNDGYNQLRGEVTRVLAAYPPREQAATTTTTTGTTTTINGSCETASGTTVEACACSC